MQCVVRVYFVNICHETIAQTRRVSSYAKALVLYIVNISVRGVKAQMHVSLNSQFLHVLNWCPSSPA